MGADKNSSRWRSKLQQDERGFQHTSPTHYPSWSSPRSHWSATGPRNQYTQPSDSSTQRNTKPRVYRPTPVRPVPTGETERLSLSGSTPVRPVIHTGQTDRSLNAPKHQTGQPTTKLTQTRNSSTTRQQRTHQDVHPSKNPPGHAPVRPVKSTGQTGVAWAARDEQHPRVNSPKSKSRSPESLHGLEQDFGDIRNTS
jgi:hypothetical protein